MAELSLRAAILVMAGGVAGCLLRYLAGVWLTRGDYPWGTLAVNLAGSFAIGVLMFGTLPRGGLSEDARLLLVTGVLGGFTTMSGFAYETIALTEREGWLRSGGYVALTLVGSIGGALAGRALARAWPGG